MSHLHAINKTVFFFLLKWEANKIMGVIGKIEITEVEGWWKVADWSCDVYTILCLISDPDTQQNLLCSTADQTENDSF